MAGAIERRNVAASWRERAAAIGVALVLVVLAALVFPVRQQVIGVIPGFLAAYGALLFASELVTMLILVWWSQRERGTATLAATYAFAAPLVAANALTLPGVVLPAGTFDAQVPAWFWFLWQIAWPLGIALYAWLPPQRAAVLPRILSSVLLSLAVVAIVLLLGSRLPVLVSLGAQPFSPLLVGIGELGIALDALALIGLLRRRGLPNLELWLAVAVVALAIDTAFTLLTNARFSLGTSFARLMGLGSGFIVLFALVYEYGRLLRQADLTARVAALSEALPQLVFATNRQGACIYVNAAFAAFTGRAPEDSLERGWVDSVHPDDLPIALEMVRLAFGSGTSRDVELRLRGAGGTHRWHLARATALADANGVPTGLLGTAVDIDERHHAAAEVARLYQREHRVVETLQAAFLPSFLPLVDGARFDAVYRPASREASVGGDWYDAFVLGDGRIGVCVGDVTGHGLDAASAMVRTRETVRAVATLGESAPAAVLGLAHRSLMGRSGAELTTALYGTFDPHTRRLAYACAGHPPPILVRDGTATLLAGGGVPFGVENEPDVAEHELTLIAGDLLALYTDGLVESERDLERGERRLLQALSTPDVDAAAIVAELVGDEVRDDVALLLLHVGERVATPNVHSGWSFRSDDAASAQPARASFLAYVTARGMPPAAAQIAELVFGELVGNVVRHAPGPIEIDLDWTDGRPLLRVCDRGAGFAPTEPTLPADVLSETGRGLFLVRAFAAEPRVVPRPGGGTEITVALAIESPATDDVSVI